MQVLIQVEVPDLHKQIHEARNRAGLTQNELSRRADMSFQNVQRIERGEDKGGAKSMPVETLLQVLQALGLSSDELIAAKQQATTLVYQTLEDVLDSSDEPEKP